MECVPNFSEGRDKQKIEQIAEAIREVDGVQLLNIDSSPAANRTVMTFAGVPDAVCEAAYRSIKKAAELIDMRTQVGVHPRIGATDVCPFVPLRHMTMNEAVAQSLKLGQRVGEELGIPVFLYEHSARAPHRRALPAIRKGQYEGMAEKIKQPEWTPDFGPSELNLQTGATVIGARHLLVAFNVSLHTTDVTKVNAIAEEMREARYVTDETGARKKVQGLLPKLRALGWYMADYGHAQVSMNLLDYAVTSPLKAWETCLLLASKMGITMAGSEVIGLIPEACLLEAGAYSFMRKKLPVPEDAELLVHEAINYLKLSRLKPFEPQHKVLEYTLRNAGL
jgi:glutamate formiminotransferase